MDQVQERIAAWEAAGLIDSATADRLRLAESERPAVADASVEPSAPRQESRRRGPSSVAAIFGPGVAIGEMFAYLGGGFLLGAYESFVVRAASGGGSPDLAVGVGAMVAAMVLAALGIGLMKGDARRRRAAGVIFAIAVLHFGVAGTALAAGARLEWPVSGVVGTGVATLVAIVLRLLHASLLTQAALLAGITSLAAVSLDWLRSVAFPGPFFDNVGELIPQNSPSPLVLVVVSAAWWLGLALLVGLMGLREAGGADEDPAAGRRASLTRLWAGLVAVVGLATSIARSEFTTDGQSVRAVEPWIGDLAILVLAAILVERAFRRDASTFVYAAALGLIVALTDFNFSYLSTGPEIGLLIEGIILLGAGIAADRLRRRIGRAESAAEVQVTPVASA
jgi:hypothetical protein